MNAKELQPKKVELTNDSVFHDSRRDYRNTMTEFADESAEGLGGSGIKRGNNITTSEQYFREKSKITLDQEYLKNLIEEKNL